MPLLTLDAQERMDLCELLGDLHDAAKRIQQILPVDWVVMDARVQDLRLRLFEEQ